jgi:hypothetical protein
MTVNKYIGGILCVSILFCGCEGLSRKFVRKPKKDLTNKEEMVLVPQEYKALQVESAQLYQEYFLYAKTWLEDFIDSCSDAEGGNRKKQMDDLEQAISNLKEMKGLLKPEKQQTTDNLISRVETIIQKMKKDVYNRDAGQYAKDAQRINRDIIRNLSISQVKQDIL